MGEKVCSSLEFNFIPDLGPRCLDRAFRQFEDPSGGPENPGYAIFPKTVVQSDHLHAGIEKQHIELISHPERMDPVARADPQPFAGFQPVGSEKSHQSGGGGVGHTNPVSQEDGPVDVSDFCPGHIVDSYLRVLFDLTKK
jgi:hypothetical protein